jgi:hypothetical protein
MSKKRVATPAPEPPPGESYSPLPSSHPFHGIVCTTCSRYLMDDLAIWRHIREGHRVKYFGKDRYGTPDQPDHNG